MSGGSLVQGADRAWFSLGWLRGLTLVAGEVAKGMRLLRDSSPLCSGGNRVFDDRWKKSNCFL